ncbi:MAG: peptidylprolyl isomerase [Pseudomonadota bacterium]
MALRTKLIVTLLAAFLTAPATQAHHGPHGSLPGGFPQVLFETTQGDFIVELEASRAPLTVRHFLQLVEADHYDATVFHRVIKNFVVQGGSHTIELETKGEAPAVVNESGNGLSNQRGTIAMARTDDPHSATASFYINLKDNSGLDPRSERWGYTVFGNVIEGMETIDKIAASPTGPAGPFAEDVPSLPVLIRSARKLSVQEISDRAKAAREAAEAELKALEESQ